LEEVLFLWFVMCSSCSSSSSSRSWDDSSSLDYFGSFLLPWFELWCELSLSTEGNQPIPHELADRAIFWSRSQEPVFFVLLRFPVDRLEIKCWCFEDIFSTLPRTYLQSFKSIWVVLTEFWPVLPWFVLLFLDSAEPPRKTRNLQESPEHGASRRKRGASVPICWNFVFGLSDCSFLDPSFALIF
jgi:hypothetical protein